MIHLERKDRIFSGVFPIITWLGQLFSEDCHSAPAAGDNPGPPVSGLLLPTQVTENVLLPLPQICRYIFFTI